MRFSKDHEWIHVDGDTATVGITAYAANALGDIVFVELPQVGNAYEASDSFAVVESVKAASDVYAPASFEVVAVNDQLTSEPQLVNADPLGTAWFAKVKLTNLDQIDALMDQADYDAFLLTL